MKLLLFFIVFSSFNYSLAEEFDVNYQWEKNDFYLPWPSEIKQSDYFYRGQATNLTSFSQMLEMMTLPKENSLVTSRLFRTIEKIFPGKNLNELLPLVQKQIDWWRKNKLIWKVTLCHVDVYGCFMPTVRQLMGIVFKKDMLSSFLINVLDRQESGGASYLDVSEMSRVLEFFDPVVSTSFYKSVADKFAKDKQGGVGYVMILNDRDHRNCKKEVKDKGNCFINHEEYLEEFEVPFWGFVLPSEFEGFIVEDIELMKSTEKSFFIEQGQVKKKLNISKLSSCLMLNSFDFNSKRKQILFKAIKFHLGCNS
jgi:hypothetical protein